MQDIAGSYPHSDSRNDNYFSVVSNLMSLVAHIQASMNMLETEITRELPVRDPQAPENVVVLDDITLCYVKANATLHACKAGLAATLRCMLDTEMPESGADEFAS